MVNGEDGEDRDVLSRPAPPPTREWRYGPLPEQVADAYLPARPGRTPVVLIHGGFWRPEFDRRHLRPLAAALAGQGHPTLSLEYRRIPGEPDTTLADLRAALAALDERAADWLPLAQPTLVGHSAGGHLCLVLAADQPTTLRSVIALAPIADLVGADDLHLDGDAVHAFLGGAAATRPDLDPNQRATPAAPVSVLHGGRDGLVPPELAQTYATRFATNVELNVMPSYGHFELIDPLSPAFAELLTAIDRTGIE